MSRYEIAVLVTATAVNLARVACFDPAASGLSLSQGSQSTQGGVPSPSQPIQPGQHPQQQPDQPSTTPNGNPNPIGQEGNAANGTGGTSVPRTASGDRWDRPFTLQSPQTEARLAEVGRRLQTMEQRMARENADLLRRIGEARQLTGERQAKATLDILQQMAQDQAELQRYLVATRTAWAGDTEAAGAAPAVGTSGRIASPVGAGPRGDIEPSAPTTAPSGNPGGAAGGADGGPGNPPR